MLIHGRRKPFDVMSVGPRLEVTVEIHCDLDRAVTELAGDVGHGDATPEHDRGVGVASVVDA